MARIRFDENGNMRFVMSEDESAFTSPEDVQKYYDQAIANSLGGRAGQQPSRIATSGSMPGAAYDQSGNLTYKPGNWGSAGYDPNEAAVNIGGQNYNRIGGYSNPGHLAGKMFQGQPFSNYVMEDPTYGTLMRSDALAGAGQYNKKDIGNYLPGLMMSAVGGLAAAGAGAAAGGAGASGGIGSSLGTGAFDMAGLGGAMGAWNAGGLGAGAGVGLGTGAQSLLGGAGDPFIDAYSAYGTGGGPTGNPFDISASLGGNAGTGAGQSMLNGLNPSDLRDFGIDQNTVWRQMMQDVPAGEYGGELSTIGSPDAINPQVVDVQPGYAGPGSPGVPMGTPVRGASGGINPPYLSLAERAARIFKNDPNNPAQLEDYLAVGGLAGSSLLTGIGARNTANSVEGIASRAEAARAPALSAYNAAVMSPDTFYNSAPAMGASNAAARALSVHGNPANNPALMAKLAAYNLGGYNDYLRSLGPLALGGIDATARGQLEAANARSGIYNAAGAGLGSLYNPMDQILRLLAQQQTRQA